MWDRHWCAGANQRVAALVEKLEPVLEAVRRKGMIVVHAPSETMDHYAGAPQRQRILAIPHAEPPKELALTSPPLPIDDSGGGCDTPGDKEHRAWTCEHAGLKIAPEDYISDNGQEIYNLLRARGIETVFYTRSAREYVHLKPHLRYPANEQVGCALHPAARFDRRHVQSARCAARESPARDGTGD